MLKIIQIKLLDFSHCGLSRILDASTVCVASATGMQSSAIAKQLVLSHKNMIAPWAIKRLIKDSIFEYPKGYLPWISHKTLGECVNSLVDKTNDIPSGHIKIQGPEPLLGNEVATKLSLGMTKPVTYEHLPYLKFGSLLDDMFGSPTGSIIAAYYYKWLEENQEAYLCLSHNMQLLGVQGETILQWAQRQDWIALRKSIEDL